MHSPQNLNCQDTLRELFISILKLRLRSVKQIYTIGRSVKKIQQSIDLIVLDKFSDSIRLLIQMSTMQLSGQILNLQF